VKVMKSDPFVQTVQSILIVSTLVATSDGVIFSRMSRTFSCSHWE